MPAQYPQYLDNDPLVTGRELLDRLPSRLTPDQFDELYWFVSREALNHWYYVSRNDDTTESRRSRRDKEIVKESKIREIEQRIDNLQAQSRLCKTSQGAAIISAIAWWMRGNYIVDGNLEPWQFVDKWVGQVETSQASNS
jgi:hypothetical protein